MQEPLKTVSKSLPKIHAEVLNKKLAKIFTKIFATVLTKILNNFLRFGFGIFEAQWDDDDDDDKLQWNGMDYSEFMQ